MIQITVDIHIKIVGPETYKILCFLIKNLQTWEQVKEIYTNPVSYFFHITYMIKIFFSLFEGVENQSARKSEYYLIFSSLIR